ncbi:reverse transcriptase family protein [Burkholderia vietnamiensis]|uniref:reverse transcriptase family protein n=1 Tax=Burkholderia vietnamiensis TaxID=60552 RepID=UPI0009BE8FE4|nr:reverse transcriptase family protein [Burkholderia vietnamiensis]MDN7923843.1 reverse transcriptase family protein [Burkholderia vietnamiensis]HDR9250229.1 RNA-directed DNA polymerase [Burkholderia vietnamiensis]
MEDWSAHQLFQAASASLDRSTATALSAYARTLQSAKLPVVFSLRHLSGIVGVSYKMLRESVRRKREAANYRIYRIAKRDGTFRHIHEVTSDLFRVQTFLAHEILAKVSPHPAAFAFHAGGGIKKCAAQHCGARWIFQYDLSNFFYSINEADVYRLFCHLGYRPLLAFEFARLSTTIRMPPYMAGIINMVSPDHIGMPYADACNKLGVLPQGAPSSPAISNLVAKDLDDRLTKVAVHYNLVYTRYADDITISAMDVGKGRSRGEIHRSVIHAIRKSGFVENESKTRIAGPGSMKLVLGLLVDGPQPRLSRQMYERVDTRLYACRKFGLEATADFYKFDSAYGFYNHLAGLLSFIKDVDPLSWNSFAPRFKEIPPP